MQVCGYAGSRYAVRRWKGIGHMSLSYAPIRGFVSVTPYAITHMGSLRIVEFQVPWITEDHGSALECWGLVLSAAFVSLEFV